jgi:uncharacterized protein (UPF0248 family)
MSKYTPEYKHSILLQYRPHTPGSGFDSLATANNIAGGGSTIQRWYKHWNKKVKSLHHKAGAGRKTILTKQEINKYILTPIKKANKKLKAIHYTDLIHNVQESTGKEISLRTIQKVGKEILMIKDKKTIPMTEIESNY